MSQQQPRIMDCIVVGGCADGTLLRQIDQDAQWIELKRPDYVKPLAHAAQAEPEVVNEKDVYEVHVIGLRNTDAPGSTIFGIAVVEGESLTWAFSQLVISHVELTTHKLAEKGLIAKH